MSTSSTGTYKLVILLLIGALIATSYLPGCDDEKPDHIAVDPKVEAVNKNLALIDSLRKQLDSTTAALEVARKQLRGNHTTTTKIITRYLSLPDSSRSATCDSMATACAELLAASQVADSTCAAAVQQATAALDTCTNSLAEAATDMAALASERDKAIVKSRKHFRAFIAATACAALSTVLAIVN